MDNQYNYYDPDDDYKYGRVNGVQPEHKPPKNVKKHRGAAMVAGVAGLAILFGVVSSAVFLTSNIVGGPDPRNERGIRLLVCVFG